MNAHETVLDDLALLIEGDETALARHAEHLASCDSCRDARHEAALVARRVAAAGADHEAASALETKVLAALDAEPAVEVKPAPAPAPVPTPARPRSRRAVYAGIAIAAVAAAAIGVVRFGGSQRDDGMTAVEAGTGAIATKIVRAAPPSDAPDAGLAVKAPGEDAFRRVGDGERIAAGSVLRTDAHTRAWLALDDGSTLSLDHATELALGAARRIELRAGRVAAEVAHVEGTPAVYETPTARVDVLGTRFVLTAAADLTSVHVTRGAVRLVAAGSGDSVEVRAGEEGTAGLAGAPEVAAVPALGADLSWAEVIEDAELGSAGLGALRAYRPGETRDRDWNLRLAHHKVTVRIVGPIARTEIEETFRNDTDHTLEGVYQFPMPADARVDALSLDVPGKPGVFEEGAFLDRERAAMIWAGVIDRATPKVKKRPQEMIWVPGPWRDPALLEWQRGGRFELRVFPIPAHGERTIKIAYTQVLGSRGAWRRYVYPLPHAADGSTAADDFTVDVRVAGAADGDVRAAGYDLARSAAGGDTTLALTQHGFVPRGDLVVEHRTGAAAELRAWTFAGDVAVAPDEALARRKRGKEVGIDPAVLAAQREIAADVRPTVLLSLEPELPRWREVLPRDYVLVVDASQSMVGERRTRAIDLAVHLIGEMDRRDRVTVLSCDAACRELPGGLAAASADLAGTARTWLAGEEPAGASDLVAALRAGLARAAGGDGREAWVVYVGDGFATTGFRRAGDVEALVGDAARAADARVTTVGVGGDADATLLAAAARGGGGHFVAWVPGQRVETAALAVLETANGSALRDATLELPAGLADVAPARLPTVRAGEQLLVAARLGAAEVKGDVVLRGTVGGKPFEQRYPVSLVPSTAPGNAFVPRMWASLWIDELERGGRGEDRARIVATSQAYGVLSRHTSLLVLESEAMFEAFGVDRGKPQVAWTGTEELEETAVDGLIAHASDDGYGKGPAPAKAPSETKKAKKSDMIMPDLFDEGGGGSVRGGDRGAPAPRMRGRGRWMRKVWYRVGAVDPYEGVHPNIVAAISDAEAALAAAPDSRDRHRALVQALGYAGELERAYQVASAWLERDRLDPQALVYMADILGRQGRRDDGVRMLGGIVDLAPDDRDLHERLAAAHERVGATAPACGHRVALAAIRDDDAATAGAAIRCLRSLGRERDAERITAGLATDLLRKRALELADGGVRTATRVSGDLTITAHWTGGADLDLSLITPQGSRVSWLGGKKGVSAADAASTRTERLALRRIGKGRYLVEIARTRAGDTTPVEGTVEITVLGVTRTLPFRLDGDRAVLGRVGVTMRSRLEEVR